MTEIVRVYVTGLNVEKVKALPPEKYLRLRSALPCSELDGDQDKLTYIWSVSTVIYSDDIEFLTQLGCSIELKSWRSTYKPFANAVADNPSAAAVHVHLPNLGLLLMDEVTNLDDACTDELQRHLEDGWRIIAICPPNGQRRPDYILGRTKEKAR
jgi:hypothetical protein